VVEFVLPVSQSNKAEKYYKLYDNDDAATAAEAALVAGVDKWEDPDFKADGSSLYKDPFHPPRGMRCSSANLP
jgi:hypothetical protein